jgi:hypothetical protein
MHDTVRPEPFRSPPLGAANKLKTNKLDAIQGREDHLLI